MFGYTAYQFSVRRPCGADVLRGCGGLLAHLRFLGAEEVCSMTKQELHEQLVKEAEVYCPNMTPEKRKMAVELVEEVLSLSEAQRNRFLDFLRLSKRANALGLDVDVDKSTKLYFIKDVATNTVIAPPPMNLETVAAWLDDYEKEAAKE